MKIEELEWWKPRRIEVEAPKVAEQFERKKDESVRSSG
jgi:hypothetical protein